MSFIWEEWGGKSEKFEITYRKPYATLKTAEMKEEMLWRWFSCTFYFCCALDRVRNINGFFGFFFLLSLGERRDHYEFYLIILRVEIFFFVLLLKFLLLLCLLVLVGGDDDVGLSWMTWNFFLFIFQFFSFKAFQKCIKCTNTNRNHHRISLEGATHWWKKKSS